MISSSRQSPSYPLAIIRSPPKLEIEVRASYLNLEQTGTATSKPGNATSTQPWPPEGLKLRLHLRQRSSFHHPQSRSTWASRDDVPTKTPNLVKTRVPKQNRTPPSSQRSDHLPDIFPINSDHSSISRRKFNPSDHLYQQRYPKIHNPDNPELLSDSNTRNCDFAFKNHDFVWRFKS